MESYNVNFFKNRSISVFESAQTSNYNEVKSELLHTEKKTFKPNISILTSFLMNTF